MLIFYKRNNGTHDAGGQTRCLTKVFPKSLSANGIHLRFAFSSRWNTRRNDENPSVDEINKGTCVVEIFYNFYRDRCSVVGFRIPSVRVAFERKWERRFRFSRPLSGSLLSAKENRERLGMKNGTCSSVLSFFFFLFFFLYLEEINVTLASH